MEHIGKTIQLKKKTVNSKVKSLLTVNSNSTSAKIDQFLEELNLEPEYFAEELARKLGDIVSLTYYILLVKNSNQSILFKALSFTLDADRRGAIKTSKPIYFLAILKKWGIRTKFKS